MDGNQKMGKTMTYLAWVMGLVLLTLFFSRYLDRQDNPNQSPESYIDGSNAVVILQQNRAGHYVTNGYINGYQVKFLLDTGATQVSIPASVAERLALPSDGKQTVNTANGVIQVYTTQLDSLAIGELTLYNLKANINPHMQGDTILLGMNALAQVKLVQQGKTLTLSEY